MDSNAAPDGRRALQKGPRWPQDGPECREDGPRGSALSRHLKEDALSAPREAGDGKIETKRICSSLPVVLGENISLMFARDRL